MPPPTFVVSGTLLLVGQPVESFGLGDHVLSLQQDGHLAVSRRDGEVLWRSPFDPGPRAREVKSVLYWNGALYFTTATDTSIFAVTALIDRIKKNRAPEVLARQVLHPVDEAAASYRLYVSDFPEEEGDYLRVYRLELLSGDTHQWPRVWASGL